MNVSNACSRETAEAPLLDLWLRACSMGVPTSENLYIICIISEAKKGEQHNNAVRLEAFWQSIIVGSYGKAIHLKYSQVINIWYIHYTDRLLHSLYMQILLCWIFKYPPEMF